MKRGLRGRKKLKDQPHTNWGGGFYPPISRVATHYIRLTSLPSRFAQLAYALHSLRSLALHSYTLHPRLSFLYIKNCSPSHVPCLLPCLGIVSRPLKNLPPNPPAVLVRVRAHARVYGGVCRCRCRCASAPLQGLVCA